MAKYVILAISVAREKDIQWPNNKEKESISISPHSLHQKDRSGGAERDNRPPINVSSGPCLTCTHECIQPTAVTGLLKLVKETWNEQ